MVDIDFLQEGPLPKTFSEPRLREKRREEEEMRRTLEFFTHKASPDSKAHAQGHGIASRTSRSNHAGVNGLSKKYSFGGHRVQPNTSDKKRHAPTRIPGGSRQKGGETDLSPGSDLASHALRELKRMTPLD